MTREAKTRNLEIVNLYLMGVRRLDIAAKFGLTVARIGQILNQAGHIEPIGRPRIGTDRDQIYSTYKNLGNMRETARQLGLNEGTVTKILRYEFRVPRVNAAPSCRVNDPAEVLRLRAKGWTYTQIAERLKITKSAVAGVLGRARNKSSSLASARSTSASGTSLSGGGDA